MYKYTHIYINILYIYIYVRTMYMQQSNLSIAWARPTMMITFALRGLCQHSFNALKLVTEPVPAEA